MHGDSATDEPKKSGFWAVGPDLRPKYQFARALAVGLMPSTLPGGVWGLSRVGAIWGEKPPEKKVTACVWGYFWGVFMMFPDGSDAFWNPQTPIWVSGHPSGA